MKEEEKNIFQNTANVCVVYYGWAEKGRGGSDFNVGPDIPHNSGRAVTNSCVAANV